MARLQAHKYFYSAGRASRYRANCDILVLKVHAGRCAACWSQHEHIFGARALSAAAAAPGGPNNPALHARLRAATADAHARLHLHPGFKAIQDGSITPAAYRALLARLLGFYLPFEAACGMDDERSAWLRADLRALGAAHQRIALCPAMPLLDGEAARLGAAYLAEGSLLGGRDLARKLDGLLGAGVIAGRRFFLGRGAATGPGWQAFLARLAAAYGDAPAAEASAVLMFGVFENWMEHWRGA